MACRRCAKKGLGVKECGPSQLPKNDSASLRRGGRRLAMAPGCNVCTPGNHLSIGETIQVGRGVWPGISWEHTINPKSLFQEVAPDVLNSEIISLLPQSYQEPYPNGFISGFEDLGYREVLATSTCSELFDSI